MGKRGNREWAMGNGKKEGMGNGEWGIAGKKYNNPK
jgi:hypothetical protein